MKWQWSIGETSAKCRPSVGKVSLIGRSNIDRLATDISTDYRATYIGRQSADCRPTIDRHIGLLSTNYRPTSGRLSTDISTDHRPTCRSTYRSICRSTLPIVKLIHFNYAVPEGTKGAMNLFIELEKHKLNQIDGRNIRTSLQKRVAFSKKNYGFSERKNRTWVNNYTW